MRIGDTFRLHLNQISVILQTHSNLQILSQVMLVTSKTAKLPQNFNVINRQDTRSHVQSAEIAHDLTSHTRHDVFETLNTLQKVSWLINANTADNSTYLLVRKVCQRFFHTVLRNTAVSINNREKLTRCVIQRNIQSRRLAAISLKNNLNLRMLHCKLLYDRSSTISRTIINNNDFPLANRIICRKNRPYCFQNRSSFIQSRNAKSN